MAIPRRRPKLTDVDLMNGPLGRWGDRKTRIIICPKCHGDYVHTERPTPDASNEFRGDAWRIPMWCEYGHEWELVIGHHKGQSFTRIENIRERADQP